MKRSEKQKRSLSLVWATLTLCTGCIGYLLSRQWLFLMGGIAGFTLITTLKK
ncbi:hypothetical protein NSA47_13130 [Irregularibacter muris]|uniref:Uncharacterized protein n=1 Tax=Irregularibacter muris TaxID=1796619 RepID=A0AAE3HFZ5_9FIRM|nr:hypothetical protein [Irregularibacter muris]MCR1899916.1 hypothetical protein [Irregularibacter muris]